MEISNKVNTAEYGVNQIKTLEGIEAIRLRAGMYIGSVGPAGVRHITLEIISNAVDEYLNGHCTECSITVSKDGTIEIEDNGRGVPSAKQKMEARFQLMFTLNCTLVRSLIAMVRLAITLPAV